MAKIIILLRGEETIVDDEDFEKYGHMKWTARPHRGKKYVVNSKKINGKIKTLRLHRVILGVTDPKIIIDHINGQPLDNRKENLRIVTNQHNCINRPKQRNNTSGFKGVSLKKYGKRYSYWVATITFNQQKINIGYFKTKEDAAKAYNDKALELFGEFAHLNIIKPIDN
jgi:hypothetical protein